MSNPMKLMAQIRGDSGAVEIPSDDAQTELKAKVEQMRQHGFRVVTTSGRKRVINPHESRFRILNAAIIDGERDLCP